MKALSFLTLLFTGFKLVEYGEDEEEDEDEDDSKVELNAHDGRGTMPYANGKPFWAV